MVLDPGPHADRSSLQSHLPTNSYDWDPDDLRTRFVVALSDMYREEVPLYGSLVQIVRQVDNSILTTQGKDPSALPVRHQLERHGAIRLGIEHELRMIRRLFALFGMYPVGYYNLGVVGLPLHAIAFRPVSETSLQKNPFRVFTTLLRRSRLSPDIKSMAEKMLKQRQLFTPRLIDIISRVEAGEKMAPQDASDLISEALLIFKWHSRSAVSTDEYLLLRQEHPMVADIACFPSAHINHLTPRTLDIDLVQKVMIEQGLPAKERIEGPPSRRCPILLRQTSIKALEEQVTFAAGGDGDKTHGTHTARFGEVEQRGAAVTRKGRELYDRLLEQATRNASTAREAPAYDTVLAETFSSEFPDTWTALRAENLVYFRYKVTTAGREVASSNQSISIPLRPKVRMEDLLALGLVECEPITYEDFLPFSAAGIFRSNIATGNGPSAQSGSTTAGLSPPRQPLGEHLTATSSLEAFENALGCKVLDEFELYAALQRESIKCCERKLGLEEIVVG